MRQVGPAKKIFKNKKSTGHYLQAAAILKKWGKYVIKMDLPNALRGVVDEDFLDALRGQSALRQLTLNGSNIGPAMRSGLKQFIDSHPRLEIT
jgi:hypothetical protein